MGEPSKPCGICGQDCAGRPRIKDPKGRYFHEHCYEQARETQAAQRKAAAIDPTPVPGEEVDPEFGMMAELIEQAEVAAVESHALGVEDAAAGGAAPPVSAAPRALDPLPVANLRLDRPPPEG